MDDTQTADAPVPTIDPMEVDNVELPGVEGVNQTVNQTPQSEEIVEIIDPNHRLLSNC